MPMQSMEDIRNELFDMIARIRDSRPADDGVDETLEKLRRAARKDAFLRLFRANSLETKLRVIWASLKREKGNTGQISACKRFSENIFTDDYPCRAIGLCGRSGSGKTHIVVCMMKTNFRRGLMPGYVDCRRLQRYFPSWEATAEKKHDASEALKEIEKSDVLYLDDLDHVRFANQHTTAPAFIAWLDGEINRRYGHAKKGLVIISEFSAKEMQHPDLNILDKIGPSFFGRIAEIGEDEQVIKSEDWRRRK